MSAKNTTHLRNRRIALLKRIVSLFVGIWLFVTPQVMFSTSVQALFDEYGSAPIPILEEEEVKHVGTTPGADWLIGSIPSGNEGVTLPQWEELPHISLHGDVPLRPPRKS